MINRLFYLTILLLFSTPTLLFAETIDKADTAWMLVSTALVMLMIPGLALFYGGMVRSINVLSAIMHSLIAMGVMGIQWYVIGYSLSWGESFNSPFIGGTEFIFLNNVGMEANGSIPHILFMMFQGMFAIITPALIGGALVERIKFSSWVIFIFFWGILVYDPLCHMVWHSNGFLLLRGSLDFAGGTVVHISSGISALVLCIFLGKRKAYGKVALPPHNLVITLLGTALLWFGWFGFNAGSALSSGGLAANALVVTHLSASAALFSWVAIEWIFLKKPSLLGAASGAVAGLVAITPAAGYVSASSSIIIGLLGGAVCFLGVRVKSKFGFDDSLDVFGIHGLGGIFGALATGLFATTIINPGGANGIFYDFSSGMNLFFEQVIAVLFTVVYSAVITLILAFIINKTIGLRVTEEQEIVGLDQQLHGEQAYQ